MHISVLFYLVAALCQPAAGLVKLANQTPQLAHSQHEQRSILGETELFLPRISLNGDIGEEVEFELPGGQLAKGIIETIANFGSEYFVCSGSVEQGESFIVVVQ